MKNREIQWKIMNFYNICILLQTVPRRNILDILNGFISMCQSPTIVKNNESPLRSYKDRLFSIYTSTLSDNSTQLRIIAG